MWVFGLRVRLCDRRRYWIPWDYSYGWWWANMWVLGIEPRVSGIAANALEHWAISSPPSNQNKFKKEQILWFPLVTFSRGQIDVGQVGRQEGGQGGAYVDGLCSSVRRFVGTMGLMANEKYDEWSRLRVSTEWRAVAVLPFVVPISPTARGYCVRRLPAFFHVGCFLCEITSTVSFFEKIFGCKCMCVCGPAGVFVYYCVQVLVEARVSWDPPQLELQVVVSPMIWVLGTRSRSSGKNSDSLTHLAISPAPPEHCFYFYFYWYPPFLGPCSYYILCLPYVLASFMSTWFKSSEMRELQLRKCLPARCGGSAGL